MKELDILINEIKTRISILENDKLISKENKKVLIKENTRFLVRVQQLAMPYLKKSEPMEREQDNGENQDRFQYLQS